MTTHTTTGRHPGTDLHVEACGHGTPVVLAHGSLATAAEEWEAQRPLAERGYHLLAPDRRGYGRSPAAAGEDFLRDAADIAALMGEGAHLVGHSYGGLGVLFATARRPERRCPWPFSSRPPSRSVSTIPPGERSSTRCAACGTRTSPTNNG